MGMKRHTELFVSRLGTQLICGIEEGEVEKIFSLVHEGFQGGELSALVEGREVGDVQDGRGFFEKRADPFPLLLIGLEKEESAPLEVKQLLRGEVMKGGQNGMDQRIKGTREVTKALLQSAVEGGVALRKIVTVGTEGVLGVSLFFFEELLQALGAADPTQPASSPLKGGSLQIALERVALKTSDLEESEVLFELEGEGSFWRQVREMLLVKHSPCEQSIKKGAVSQAVSIVTQCSVKGGEGRGGFQALLVVREELGESLRSFSLTVEGKKLLELLGEGHKKLLDLKRGSVGERGKERDRRVSFSSYCSC